MSLTPQDKLTRRYLALGAALAAGDTASAQHLYRQLGPAIDDLLGRTTQPWTPPDTSAEFDQLLAQDGDTLDVVLDRDFDVVDRDGLDLTFSAKAMEYASWQALAWLGTRIMRAAEAGISPQQARISITVALDTGLVSGPSHSPGE